MNDFVEKMLAELVSFYREDPRAFTLTESDPLKRGQEYVSGLMSGVRSEPNSSGWDTGELFGNILNILAENEPYMTHLGKSLV